jgi:ATP-binding cassette subfamily B protein
LKILDEPTAALDPVSESAVYKNFERISKGQTTIFISHRLGSTKLADIIFVLSDGKIIERGSHSELMEIENGIYAEMFNSQAEWYKTKEALMNV